MFSVEIDDSEMCFVLLFISLERTSTCLCSWYNKTSEYLLYCANVVCTRRTKNSPKRSFVLNIPHLTCKILVFLKLKHSPPVTFKRTKIRISRANRSLTDYCCVFDGTNNQRSTSFDLCISTLVIRTSRGRRLTRHYYSMRVTYFPNNHL